MNLLRLIRSVFGRARRVVPSEGALRVRSGQAVLVDIREPVEWVKGVADSARLLPMSDLVGRRKRWGPFLEETKGKEMLLYCAVGGRAGIAARILQAEGYRVGNAGGLRDWVAAGWPIARPSDSG